MSDCLEVEELLRILEGVDDEEEFSESEALPEVDLRAMPYESPNIVIIPTMSLVTTKKDVNALASNSNQGASTASRSVFIRSIPKVADTGVLKPSNGDKNVSKEITTSRGKISEAIPTQGEANKTASSIDAQTSQNIKPCASIKPIKINLLSTSNDVIKASKMDAGKNVQKTRPVLTKTEIREKKANRPQLLPTRSYSNTAITPCKTTTYPSSRLLLEKLWATSPQPHPQLNFNGTFNPRMDDIPHPPKNLKHLNTSSTNIDSARNRQPQLSSPNPITDSKSYMDSKTCVTQDTHKNTNRLSNDNTLNHQNKQILQNQKSTNTKTRMDYTWLTKAHYAKINKNTKLKQTDKDSNKDRKSYKIPKLSHFKKDNATPIKVKTKTKHKSEQKKDTSNKPEKREDRKKSRKFSSNSPEREKRMCLNVNNTAKDIEIRKPDHKYNASTKMSENKIKALELASAKDNNENKERKKRKRCDNCNISSPKKRFLRKESEKKTNNAKERIINSVVSSTSNMRHPRIQAPEGDDLDYELESNFDLRSKLSRKNEIFYKKRTNHHEALIKPTTNKIEMIRQPCVDTKNLIRTVNNENAKNETTEFLEVGLLTENPTRKKYKRYRMIVKFLDEGSTDESSSENTLEDSDSPSSVANENCGKQKLDLSFLDDFNVDEIVDSLCDTQKICVQENIEPKVENIKTSLEEIREKIEQPDINKTEIKPESMDPEIQSDNKYSRETTPDKVNLKYSTNNKQEHSSEDVFKEVNDGRIQKSKQYDKNHINRGNIDSSANIADRFIGTDGDNSQTNVGSYVAEIIRSDNKFSEKLDEPHDKFDAEKPVSSISTVKGNLDSQSFCIIHSEMKKIFDGIDEGIDEKIEKLNEAITSNIETTEINLKELLQSEDDKPPPRHKLVHRNALYMSGVYVDSEVIDLTIEQSSTLEEKNDSKGEQKPNKDMLETIKPIRQKIVKEKCVDSTVISNITSEISSNNNVRLESNVAGKSEVIDLTLESSSTLKETILKSKEIATENNTLTTPGVVINEDKLGEINSTSLDTSTNEEKIETAGEISVEDDLQNNSFVEPDMIINKDKLKDIIIISLDTAAAKHKINDPSTEAKSIEDNLQSNSLANPDIIINKDKVEEIIIITLDTRKNKQKIDDVTIYTKQKDGKETSEYISINNADFATEDNKNYLTGNRVSNNLNPDSKIVNTMLLSLDSNNDQGVKEKSDNISSNMSCTSDIAMENKILESIENKELCHDTRPVVNTQPSLASNEAPNIEEKKEKTSTNQNTSNKPDIAIEDKNIELRETKELSLVKTDTRKVTIIPSLHDLNKDQGIQIEKTILENLKLKINVISIIHQGKFSKIFKCNDEIGQNYTIKMKKKNANSFENEVLLNKLQNDVPEDFNFVRLIHTFDMDRQRCYLLEWFPMNLQEAMKDGLFKLDKVKDLAKQLVSAVLMMRTNNIVHSDIKPTHIMLNASQTQLKLSGFDEAYNNDKKHVLPNIGTSKYRPPEVIIGFSASFSIDVWTTALVIYEMAAGSRLFENSYNNDILFSQMCIFGKLPLDMVRKARYSSVHFAGTTFRRIIGPQSQYVLYKMQNFTTNRRMTQILLSACNHNRLVPQNMRAHFKQYISQLGTLLNKMLTLDPRRRISIEFVYADPFFK